MRAEPRTASHPVYAGQPRRLESVRGLAEQHRRSQRGIGRRVDWGRAAGLLAIAAALVLFWALVVWMFAGAVQ